MLLIAGEGLLGLGRCVQTLSVKVCVLARRCIIILYIHDVCYFFFYLSELVVRDKGELSIPYLHSTALET